MSIKNILEYLEETVRRVPERVAFVDETSSLTFDELWRISRAIGSAIAARVQPRQPVVLLMADRSVQCVAAMLGVLYAGCSYVPLDVHLPMERLGQIGAQLQPMLVLHDDRGAQAASAFPCEKLTWDAAAAWEICQQRLEEIRQQAQPQDPMAILFTSGSTGVPKGVVQSMRSHVLYTQVTIQKYGFTERDIFGNQSPFFYANSIIDIFPTLALGARTVIFPAKSLAFPQVLLEWMNGHGVTELTMTPSSYVQVASSGTLGDGSLPHLKYIILSGEAAHWDTLQKWMRAAPNAGVWNFYGSTELYSVAVWRLNRSFEGEKVIPVGPTFDGVEIRFQEENGSPAPKGEAGEMVIHTPWLADGYYGDAQRTDAVFFTDTDGRRFYRTGDLGRMNEDGHLCVLGRRDAQIKHMGYRMEIGEVEQALLCVEGLREGCCLFDRESGLLHCFYAGTAEPKAVAAALKKKLPRYAIPDRFHPLEAMPHTANMKIDRKKLKESL